MKERIQLSKNLQVGDLAATAFKPDYFYLEENGITLHFDPSIIPPLRLVYPGSGRTDDRQTLIMPQATATRLQAALAEVFTLAKGRMESPFVPIERIER
jgi:hypothetical protein